MRKYILNKLRRILGTHQILEQMRTAAGAGSGSEVQPPQRIQASNLDILPGTPYSRFGLPIEYPPSRDFNPRYGFSRGKIQALDEWFGLHIADYSSFLQYMRTFSLPHIRIKLEDAAPLKPAWVGGPIAAFDTLALYAMVRKYRPGTYLEIGSGMTTCFARQAVVDGGLSTKVISIDPEPRREISEICDSNIRHGLEECKLDVFDGLESGDILFFDGSHRTFMNSDVTVFFIDVLPRIKPGVIIHLHDINLPWDYPDSFKHWYWNEQYMLAVYLMCSKDRLNPLLPTTYICRHPELDAHFQTPFIDLGSAEMNGAWRGGGSMWFTKRAGP